MKAKQRIVSLPAGKAGLEVSGLYFVTENLSGSIALLESATEPGLFGVASYGRVLGMRVPLAEALRLAADAVADAASKAEYEPCVIELQTGTRSTRFYVIPRSSGDGHADANWMWGSLEDAIVFPNPAAAFAFYEGKDFREWIPAPKSITPLSKVVAIKDLRPPLSEALVLTSLSKGEPLNPPA